MNSARYRRLLVVAITSLVVMGVSETASAACPPPKAPTCDPDFTGRLARCPGADQDRCRGERGPRGPRGQDGKRGERGERGKTGRTGARGIQGVAGAVGAAGAAGVRGATGSAGADGTDGAAGSDGTDGAAGADGTDGTNGTNGTAGEDGTDGTNGTDGEDGLPGQDGLPGEDGTDAIDGYLYAYNSSPQSVGVEEDINFDVTAAQTAGLVHVPGTAVFVVANAGFYLVSFSVTADEPNQVTVFVDGAPVPGATYASGSGSQQNTGQVILQMNAGSELTLRNHTSITALTLADATAGLAENVNASVTIQALG